MIVHVDQISFPGGPTELPMYRRVKLDSESKILVLAGAEDRSEGTLARKFMPEFNSEALVVPWHNGGTRMMIADGPIPSFGYCKNSNDGKITFSDEANAKGRLMSDAAIQAGDAVECSPYSNAD